MSLHPYLEIKEQSDYENVIQRLKVKGVRITETRKAVIAYMIRTHDHPSAEKIYSELRSDFPNMSLATVYNNLKVLIEEGFVEEIKIKNELGVWELPIFWAAVGFTDGSVSALGFFKMEKKETGFFCGKQVSETYFW